MSTIAIVLSLMYAFLCTQLELAHGELLEESEVYEGQLESLKRLQYTPLLAEVNKHQCDFGLPEVEEAVYLKGLPKTGKVEEKPKAPR